MSNPFRIKICGITNQADAQMAVEAGADALGFNFYDPSPRSVRRETVVDFIGWPRVARVGVFVNHSIQDIHRIADTCSLDFVQLHGDETPEFAADLDEYNLIPVVRVRESQDLESVKRRIDSWLESDCRVSSVLLDASVGKAYGGTGHTLDWGLAAKVVAQFEVPVVLAGGLKPGNVAAAIMQVGPAAVDVASGVEMGPGEKSAEKVASFVENAREALGL